VGNSDLGQHLQRVIEFLDSLLKRFRLVTDLRVLDLARRIGCGPSRLGPIACRAVDREHDDRRLAKTCDRVRFVLAVFAAELSDSRSRSATN